MDPVVTQEAVRRAKFPKFHGAESSTLEADYQDMFCHVDDSMY